MGQRTLKVDKIIPEGGILHIDGQVTATSLQETSNPWEPVNDVDIKFISGNVGVGTDTPTYKLDVHGTANVGVLTTTSISGDGSGLTNIQKANIPDLIQEQWTTLNDNILYFQNSNVGIGTSTPAYKLDVHGTANVGALNVTSITGDGSGLTNIDGSAINNLVNQWTSDENDLRYEDGKVGVGKGTPNHTFDVNGNVNATSLSLSDSDIPVYLTSNASAASIAQWANEIGGDTNIVRDVAIDSNGNTFVTGEYTSSVGVEIGTGVSLSSTTETNVYLIKYNSSGVAEWALNMIGQGNTVTIDSDGNVYISGRYDSGSNINVPSTDETPLIGKLVLTMGDAAFLVKYNNDGVAQWATRVDGTDVYNGDDIGRNLAIDSSGNLYLTGSYNGNYGFNIHSYAYSADGTSPNIQLPVAGNDSAFLIKYNSDGTPQWVRVINASGNTRGYGVAVDSGSNVFITGEYTATSEVDVGNSKNLPITTNVASFLVKYDTSGTTQWATKIDGSSTDKGVSVVTGKNGNVHLIGNYTSGAIIISPSITLPDTGGNDTIFLLTYDTEGVPQWATIINGVGTDGVTDSTGAIFVTGSYSSLNSNVSSIDGKDITLVTPNGSATFLVEYSPNGILRSSTHIDGTSNESGNALAVDSLGRNVCVSGTTGSDSVIYNSIGTLSGLTLTSGPGFVVKYEISKPLKLNVSSNLEVGTANLFVDTMTGRVGANTTTPQATLHVEGNVYASSNLEVGTANLFVDTATGRVGANTTTPQATLHVEGNVYASSNLEVGGANLFVDTQTSRVGVGTRAPDATLHVEGNVYASSNLEVGGANLFVDTQTSRVGVGTRAPDATLHVEGNVYASSNLEVGGANLFVDTQTSRVGVGTRAPDATLHVEGNVYASSNLEVGGANLFVDTQTSRVGVGTRAPDATLHVEGNVYASSNLEVGGANLFVDTQTSRVGVGTRAPDATLHVEGNVYASSNLEVGGANLFVDTQTSRVGVGTRAPDATLHVEGNVYASSNLEVGGANLFVDTEVSRVGVRTRVPGFDLDVNGDINFTGDFYKNGVLFTAIVGSTPWSTLNSNISYTAGNVSIGVIEPSATLHVEGNVYASSNLEVGGANLFVDTQTSRVGVGTRAPEANLHVEGNAYVSSNLEVGGANLFVDTQTSRVGVGTRAPEANLHVEGNAYVSSNLEVSNINFTGSFNQNGAPFVSSPWTITGDDLSYTTGRVGVGTSSPNANLHVEGDAYVSSNLEVGKTTISTPDQTPNVLWATSIGGTSFDDGRGIATDSNGNVYVIGYSRSSSITIGSTTLTNSGSYDVFVAKYDASGTVQWATSIGGTSADLGIDIATDSLGNVYLVGYYSGTATFGSTTLTGAGSYDVFVAKYDTSGTVQWATSIGGTDSEIGNGIATDSNGNVYVTGNYRSSITIGSTTLTNSGFDDVFVAKYDTSGTVQWATSIGGTSTDNGYGIATDSNGNVYVIGEYNSGSITIGSTTLTGAGSYDVFVAKYDTSGTVQWATSIGGTNSEYGRGIATDSNGNVYVIGGYSGTLTIGSTTLTGAGSNDAFVAKYDTSGTVQWATSIGGTSYDNGYGIATDSGGNVYVTGNYSSGSITIGSTTLTSAGSDDAFVAKYDTSGTVQWATSIGGTSTDLGIDIATDSNGNVYVIGNYYGSITIGSTTLTNSGSRDAFVVKYSSPPIYLRINAGLEVGSSNLFVDTRTSRVGIGTTTPGYTLDVQGDLNVSGTTTNVSDKRLKSNVHVIENALEKVGKLSGYTFTMNNKQNAGVIAQEVLEVLPEVVGGSEETTYSVAYGNMASLFIEAIKELKREIEVLKTKD